MLSLYREQCRAELLARPFPCAWESWLAQNVHQFRLLGQAEKNRVRDDVQILVAEKNWEGCNGLVVSDEIKVTIAGQACLLTIGLDVDCFARLRSILVYPSAFLRVERFSSIPSRGVAVYRGPVILAWDCALSEGRDPASENNLTVHEFAHQLDFLDGGLNGTPLLSGDEKVQAWERVMTKAYVQQKRATRRGHKSFLGDYAAKDPCEFFAVCSERFYTQPQALHDFDADVYELLVDYYRVDPRIWYSGPHAAGAPVK